MNSSLALLVCFVGIAGLFYLDRDKSVQTSKALWLSVIWLWIVGSRPISVWMGVAPTNGSDQLDGSPLDRLIFSICLALGIIVLVRRSKRTSTLLRGAWTILLYFSYCLLSVSWSDFADISFKRWIKAIGDLVVVLIILTDVEPVVAFKRIISRVGFVLMPASVLLIKYFGDLGRGFDPSGDPMNTGVTTNKNTLGVVTLVLALGALWNVLSLLRPKGEPRLGRHVIAQVTLLAIAVVVLTMAHSATSWACFLLGAGLMLVTSLPVVRSRPANVHAVVVAIFLVGGLVMFFGSGAAVVHALGRQTNFTGRTDIWAAVIPVVPNSIVGAGFESFWLGPRLNEVWGHLSRYMHVNEAHNGYLEVYLNLGWVGVGLIVLILAEGYRKSVAAFRRDPMIGSMLLAYTFAAVFYSISEAGFRVLNPIWVFLLLAVVAGGGISAGASEKAVELIGEPASRRNSSSWPGPTLSACDSHTTKNVILQLQEWRRVRGGR